MKNQKNAYCEPKLEIIVFSSDDVVALSDGPMTNVQQGKSKEFDYMSFFG